MMIMGKSKRIGARRREDEVGSITQTSLSRQKTELIIEELNKIIRAVKCGDLRVDKFVINLSSTHPPRTDGVQLLDSFNLELQCTTTDGKQI